MKVTRQLLQMITILGIMTGLTSGCTSSRLIPQGYPPPAISGQVVMDIARLREGPSFSITENFFVNGTFVADLAMGDSLRINLDPGTHHFCLLYSATDGTEDVCLNDSKLSSLKPHPDLSLTELDEQECSHPSQPSGCVVGLPDIFTASFERGRYCFFHSTPKFKVGWMPYFSGVEQFKRIPCSIWEERFGTYKKIIVN